MIPMRHFALGETIRRVLLRPYGGSLLRRISITIGDSMDSQILTHEQRAIELLARTSAGGRPVGRNCRFRYYAPRQVAVPILIAEMCATVL